MSKPATTIDLAAFKKQLADSLERSAKSAGQTIVKESFTCEIAPNLQVMTAAIQRDELPTEKEITTGVDLFFAYVSIDGQKVLPPAHYRIRLALPGYDKKGEVKVSFVDSKGKIVHTITGQGSPRRLRPRTEDAVVRTITVSVSVCGRKKCFNLDRNGFLDWTWGCSDRDGNVVAC